MICDHFQATRAYNTAQCLADLFNIWTHGDDVQDFGTRWNQVLLVTSETPEESVLGGLCKMKFQGSKKQTALVRQHIDQTITTRTFKARSDRIETGVLVMSEKREKSQC